ncbi:MAG: hypothetical protein OXC11_11055 [Rhodospirillales bacterium]|nr:hypothetical protein [Rhodospirillales bacterium]
MAEYRCLSESCGYRWTGRIDSAHAGCIKCGHLYVKWENYEEWRRANG